MEDTQPKPGEGRRDSRIPELIRILQEAWEKEPYSRLGQLLANAIEKHDGKTITSQRLFYIEDSELGDILEKR